MKHPDGTPMTPTEWTAERVRRWEWLDKQERSDHPAPVLTLYRRYAEGEVGNTAELVEGLHRHYNKRRFPHGPDGPEVFGPPATPAAEEAGPVEFSDVVIVLEDDPPHLPREGQKSIWDVEKDPDDPSIGQWISFTASPYPEDDEEGRKLN